MKFNLIFIILFLDSIYFSISFVQQWNFFNTAIELFSPSDTSPINITAMDETKDDINIKLYKYFAKEDGKVVYQKYLKVFDNGDKIYDGEVLFDKIDNYYRFNDKIIICPKGKYHPILFNDNFLSTNNDTLKEIDDWELQCFKHVNMKKIIL